MERANHVTPQLCWAVGLSSVLGLFASTAGAGISVEIVMVGDPGNVGELSGRADLGTERLCGAVPYIYQIGKYEVSNAQYRQFLNSVARYGDPYTLYRYIPGGTSHNGTPIPDRPMEYSGIARTGAGTVGNPYVYILRRVKRGQEPFS